MKSVIHFRLSAALLTAALLLAALSAPAACAESPAGAEPAAEAAAVRSFIPGERAPTCTEPGLIAGPACVTCGGTAVAMIEVPALGHDYVVARRTLTQICFACTRCGDSYWIDNPGARNLLPGLVRGADGADADYSAGVSWRDGRRVLTVTPDADGTDGAAAALRLTLQPESVKEWLREGIPAVVFRYAGEELVIELADLGRPESAADADAAEAGPFVFGLPAA